MASDLKLHLEQLRVVDTHEHLMGEDQWLEKGPGDVLADLFGHYAHKDLIAAGVSAETMTRVLDAGNPDLEQRWQLIESAWHAMQFTGYGEALRLAARHVYGIEEISPASLGSAAPRLQALRQPGQRYQFLSEVAHLDHVQVNQLIPTVDKSGPEFFLYDLSWAALSCGGSPALFFQPHGYSVTDLASLKRAIEAYFNRYGPLAIAVKTQHAYNRTLHWQARSDGEAERALAVVLKDPQNADEASRLCLGDWCLGQGVTQAIGHRLPVKIHTGYYYNNNVMVMERIRPSLLCPLLIRYPEAKFVLMHTGYPYGHELPALAKHFGNVYVDLCWAWAMDPFATMDVVRRFVHAAPSNKLFAFGGDTHSPTSTYGYLLQMRRWLGKTLEAEMAEGTMSEGQAMVLATSILRENQLVCFDVSGRRALLRAAAAVS